MTVGTRNLCLKDTLGPADLSTVERLSMHSSEVENVLLPYYSPFLVPPEVSLEKRDTFYGVLYSECPIIEILLYWETLTCDGELLWISKFQ